jgi:hypothetical protein
VCERTSARGVGVLEFFYLLPPLTVVVGSSAELGHAFSAVSFGPGDGAGLDVERVVRGAMAAKGCVWGCVGLRGACDGVDGGGEAALRLSCAAGSGERSERSRAVQKR